MNIKANQMNNPKHHAMRRRGNVPIFVALLLTSIAAAAAMSVDISWLVACKQELRVGTDNCAMATALFIMRYCGVDSYTAKTVLSMA